MTRRILVIQLERLGDLVQTTPLLIGLSRAIPQATIDVLAWTEFASIIEGLPGVTLRTLPSRHVRDLNDDVEQARARNLEPHSALRSLAELALPAYDRIINVTHGAFASWLSGRLSAPVRDGGFINETGEWLYAGDWLTLLVAMSEIRRENLINIVDLYRACAAAGPPSDDAHAHAICSECVPFTMPEGAFAVIAPGANEPQRQFNVATTIQVLAQIHSMGLQIVLAGAASDREFANTLVASAAVPLIDLTGKTDVQQLAHVLKRAAIVVAGDSGTAHIAAALGRPLVALYGASLAPFTTAPWGQGHVMLIAESMEAFSRDLIMSAIRMRLEESGTPNLRREAVAARVQAWRTAMLPATADPLGGVTYLPLHSDRLEQNDIARRLTRHAIAATIMQGSVDSRHLWSLAPNGIASEIAGDRRIIDLEQQLDDLASDVGRGLTQLRAGQFESLQELAGRVSATIVGLREQCAGHAASEPVILFLDWKLRVLPAYSPERIFQENEAELRRAARTLRMIRAAAAKMN